MKFDESLLEDLATGAGTVTRGRLDGVDDDGRVWFRARGRDESVPVVLGLAADDETIVRAARAGAPAVALRPGHDGDAWILAGLLRDRVGTPEAGGRAEIDAPATRPDEAVIDGRTVRFEARDEIVLRCGKGSITLRRDGKIVIKGTQLLSRATGVHRIKGGQVNIN